MSSARKPLNNITNKSANVKRNQQQTSDTKPYKVFKSTLRAKKLYKQYDTGNTGYINKQQLQKLLHEFLNSNYQTYDLTSAQLDYIFTDMDLNHDQLISLNEFTQYMVGIQRQNDTEPVKPTQIIYKPLVPDENENISISDMLSMLESLYLYNERSYRDVDLTNAKQCTQTQLRKILNGIVLSEATEAKTQQRAPKSWSVHALHKGGITQIESDILYTHIRDTATRKLAKGIDLTVIFEKSKSMKREEVKAKKPKTTVTKKIHKVQLINGIYEIYTLKSVHSDAIQDFVNEQVFNKLCTDNTTVTYKCHPKLQHWGTDLCTQHGLSHLNNGYKQYILHSHRTKLKQCFKYENCIKLYATCRISFTYLCYIEQLLHICITFDLNEAMKHIECQLKRSWLDCEADILLTNDVIDKWSEIVGEDNSEVSVPL